MTLGERLKELRQQTGFSQEQVAELLQVHQTTYSDYELGRVNIPVSALCRLAEFYHTSIDYLVGLTDERRAYPRRKA